MEPYYLKFLKKKKRPSHKGVVIIAGIVSFLLCYFFILGPIRQMGTSCPGEGLFNCPYVVVFSFLIAAMVVFCGWYILS